MKQHTKTATFKEIFLIVFLVFFISLDPVFAQDEMHKQKKADSLERLITESEGIARLNVYKEIYGTSFWDDDVESVITITDRYIEEARIQNNKGHEGYAMNAKLNLYKMRKPRDDFFVLIEEFSQYFREKEMWQYYFLARGSLLDVLEEKESKSEAYEYALELYKEAKEVGYEPAIGTMAFRIGRFLKWQEKFEEALVFLRESVDRLVGHFDHYRLEDTYQFLINTLVIVKEYDEAAVVLDKWGALREEKGAHALYDMDYLSSLFNYYLEIQDLQKAEMAKNRLEELVNENPHYRYNYLLCCFSLYRLKGEYDMAINSIDEAIKDMEDTEQYFIVLGLKKQKLEYMEEADRTEGALQAYKDYIHLRDSLDNAMSTSKLEELRTVYEVDKLTAEKEIHRQRWIIAILGCALLFVALAIFIAYSRRLAKKNMALYKQIKELNSKEKAVEQCLLRRPDETLNKELQLFKRLSEYLQSEKSFTNTDFNRKMLADAMGTNEKYLADAIKAGGNDTFSGYMAHLRLQYALELLNNRPEMTLDVVAVDSGHGSYSQFFRSFSKKYGITPSEYRKMSAKSMSGNKE